MRLSRNQFRIIYAAFVIAAFFVPAYDNTSAFRFLRLALGSVGNDPEVTIVDVLVVLLPLLLIPASALLIMLRAAKGKPFNGILLSLPLFFLLFFSFILSFDLNRQASSTHVISLIKDMSIGFYIAALASVLLLFSYSKRESLNLGSRG